MVKYTVNVGSKNFQTDKGNTDVGIILHGKLGQTKEFLLENALKNESKIFSVESTINIPEVNRVEIWKEDTEMSSKWFLDYIEVTNMDTNIRALLPGQQWICDGGHYFLKNINTRLPQDEPFKELRAFELSVMKKKFQLAALLPGWPPMLKDIPEDEVYSLATEYLVSRWNVMRKVIANQLENNGTEWKDLDDYKSCYEAPFYVPRSSSGSMYDDASFGRQRLIGANNSVIKLCTKIPDKFGVTEDMMIPLLEGNTIAGAIEKKRLFLVDYEIFDGVPDKTRDLVVPAPFALFYFTDAQKLMPVAIQLYQQKALDNPVFLPTDDKNTWLLAKLWFNVTDACYAHAINHYNNHHLHLDGVSVVTKRQLASSHPIFKFLEPHFFSMHRSNAIGAIVLWTPWTSDYTKFTNAGLAGQSYIIKKASDQFRWNVQGDFVEHLKERGVFDQSVLTGAYHFRDDGLLVYEAISKYVDKYVKLYYGKEGAMENDQELQAWGAELVKSRLEGGCGHKGLPDNGKFETVEQLVKLLTAILYSASASHCASNYPLYEELGVPFKAPFIMHGLPPKNKRPVTTDVLLKTVPNRYEVLGMMANQLVTSYKFTLSLGDFENQLIVDPPAIKILDEFRQELLEVGKKVDERNSKREFEYRYLHPRNIPNSSSV